MEHDGDTEEYVATEEYEDDTEEYISKDYTQVEYEKQILKLGGDARRRMKRSTSEIYVNKDVDVGCVQPGHINQKRSKQGFTSSKEYPLMDTENQKVASLDSGRHEPEILQFGVDGTSMKHSCSEIYVNEVVDGGCVPPAHVDQKRSKQGCASSEEIAHGTPPGARLGNLPQQIPFPSDRPEGESLSGAICPSSRTYCRPCSLE